MKKNPALPTLISRDSFLAAIKSGEQPQGESPGEKFRLMKGYSATVVKAGEDLATEAGATDPERTLSFTISTVRQDRDRDTIDPVGWAVDDYLRNPVVLWAHDYTQPSIGKALSVGGSEEGVSSLAEFASADIYPFADTIFKLLTNGFLRAVSVGFWPVEWVFNEESGGIDFKKQELWEYSVVPIPSNPDALMDAKSKGIDLEPIRDWAIKALDEWSDHGGIWVPRERVERTFKLLSPRKFPDPVQYLKDETGMKALEEDIDADKAVEEIIEGSLAGQAKRGRVLSKKNEELLASARDNISAVLQSVAQEEDDSEDDSKSSDNVSTDDALVLELADNEDPADSDNDTKSVNVEGLDLDEDQLRELVAGAVRSGLNTLTGRVE